MITSPKAENKAPGGNVGERCLLALKSGVGVGVGVRVGVRVGGLATEAAAGMAAEACTGTSVFLIFDSG